MKTKMLLPIIFISVVFSCSLRRNNPLDPSFSGIKAPAVVKNILVTRVNSSTSTIEWEMHEDSEVDGYFISRSFHYNGEYPNDPPRKIMFSRNDTLFVDNTAIYDSDHGIWSYYEVLYFSLQSYKQFCKSLIWFFHFRLLLIPELDLSWLLLPSAVVYSIRKASDYQLSSPLPSP